MLYFKLFNLCKAFSTVSNTQNTHVGYKYKANSDSETQNHKNTEVYRSAQ